MHAAALLEAAFITGFFNEKTIRTYKNDYFTNKGHFSEPQSGKYKRMSLLNDENLRLEAAMWVRENTHKKCSANMTAYRDVYLTAGGSSSVHLHPPPCSDERAGTPPLDAEQRKKLVLILLSR